jgi:hypothetical protein
MGPRFIAIRNALTAAVRVVVPAAVGVPGSAKETPVARTGATICLTLVLAGCALFVRTNVEVFHDLPANYAGQEIAIIAADPNKADTIEFRTYASKLATRLVEAGFRVVSPDPDAPPDYVAALAYGVGAQQAGAAYTSGHVSSGGSYHGITTVGREHPRAVVVGIVRVPKGEDEEPQQVYSMTAISTGRCRSLSAVIDPILDAAFKDFPGDNGRSRTVRIPTPGLSC